MSSISHMRMMMWATCLSEDLLSVDTWLNANKRTLNMTKSECMLIGSVQRP